MNVGSLDYVVASHQDPDIVASLNKWLVGTDAKVVVPALWERFIRISPDREAGRRVVPIPTRDESATRQHPLQSVPAHFCTPRQFPVYDPQSRILFSGDLGANLCPREDLDQPAKRLEELLP